MIRKRIWTIDGRTGAYRAVYVWPELHWHRFVGRMLGLLIVVLAILAALAVVTGLLWAYVTTPANGVDTGPTIHYSHTR